MRGKKRTTLVIAGILAGVAAITTTYFALRSTDKPQPPHTQTPEPPAIVASVTYAPMWSEIEPADGAVVRGAETWVRWSAPQARGRVLWRKAGAADFITVDANDGDPLLARLGPLHAGEAYEYIVESRIGDETQRSGLRKFTDQNGLAFDPAPEQTIKRDYDQTVKLTLQNTSDQKITVAARALAKFADLPADIVGPGSVEDPAEVAAGGKLELRLAVAAPDATRATYDIPVEAAGATTIARVRIAKTNFKLSFNVLPQDPRTLARTVEIKNEGDLVADLAVRIAPPNNIEVRLQPSANHATLLAGETLRFLATPVLYLEFESLKVEVECRAAGESIRHALEFMAPVGQRLIGVRGGSSARAESRDGFCPNHPNTCSDLPGPEGNGPAPKGGTPVGGSARGPARMSPPRDVLGEALLASNLRDARVPRDRFGGLLHEGGFIAQAERGEPGTGGKPAGEAGPGQDKPARQGVCGDPRNCSDEEIAHCFIEGRRLQELYLEARGLADSLLNQRQRLEEELQQLPLGSDEKLWRQAFLNSLHGREKYARDQQNQYEKLYEQLRKKCYEKCGILLPEITGDRVGGGGIITGTPADVLRERLKRATAFELGKAGLPEKFAELTESEQDSKILDLVVASFYRDRSNELDWDSSILGLVGVPGIKIDPITGGVLSVISVLADAQSRLANWEADNYTKSAADPPSPAYAQVVSADVQSIAAPKVASELQHLGWEAVVARRWRLAYLKAWLTTYERYQGARNANDRQAMVLQARAMVSFADRALEASHVWAIKWDEFQHQALKKLLSVLKEDGVAGRPWEEIISTGRKEITDKGLPAKLREDMIAAGNTEADIKEFGNRLLKLTPERARMTIARWRLELNTLEGQVGMPRKDRARSIGPKPYDLPSLIYRQHFSRDLLAAANSGADQPASHDHARARNKGPELSWREVHPGFLEALQHRASFTRAHRGPLAGALDGDLADSSDTPVGFHTGDRVCFAWHHSKDQIVFAAFDPRGEVLMAPQVIGKGRWPRLAADDKRAAVTWSRGDGFVVRLLEGKKWSDEIALTGKEAAIAFGPGGILYAATSTGLWKLADKGFERVQETAYAQPALAIDSQGRPVVAWNRSGKIVVGETVVADGERPALTVTPDGTLHLAYLANGTLILRSRKGDAWTAPQTIPAKKPSWLALAMDKDGVRLTYLGAAEHGPDALWLVRSAEKEPILLPSLAGNVTEAWLQLQFALPYYRWYYRPYDVWVSVNDVVVGTFDNAIPEGRYLFRLNPYQVFTSSGRPVSNRIAIRSWHMNGGFNATSSYYELIVRLAWSERFGYGANANEVRSAAHPGFNHDQPDVTVLANVLDLPIKPPSSGRVDFAVKVVNLGEVDSRPTRLAMFHKEKGFDRDKRLPLQVEVPPLKPGAQWTVTMRLDGRVESVSFRLQQSQPDFDPRNDSLTLRLWGANDPSLSENPVASIMPDPVKDFTLPSARDSSLVRLSDHSGKVILINWWRTSCGFSEKESPNLVALDKKYRSRGLVILGVSDDTSETVGDVPAYLKRHNIAFPVGLNDQGEFMREIRPKGSGDTPGNYLVSRSGELIFLGLDRSPEDWKKVEAAVVRLLDDTEPGRPAIRPRPLDTAPAFSLTDLAGKKVSLKDFGGKPLVVNFFDVESDWAGPALTKLHKEYGDRGLQVVGINLFDKDADIRKYVQKHQVKYAILRGDEAAQKAWIGSAKPWATFFVSADGKLVKTITDAIENGLEEPVFRKYAEHLLAK